jgi:hypothetical protein
MSAFALYAIGFLVFIGGVLYAETLLHVPQTWTNWVRVDLAFAAPEHKKTAAPPIP